MAKADLPLAVGPAMIQTGEGLRHAFLLDAKS